ncbi:hypothetical protein CYMTET_7922 [Cymbomonas tetramitiformis]|uniref:Uncharacterized protein n=1 Tax=Cymbomonas tetramitiformis TaxID=36881 RepID=A0AAE0GVY7_9CHLO|nr:hypothetical protein CYMTET_7922 [Cymbomonas tetramitiformis]
MAQQRRAMDKRRQTSLLGFGVKLGVAPSAVNADPSVNRPEPKRSVQEILLLFFENVLRHVGRKGPGRSKKLAFIDSNPPLVKCDLELGQRLAALRDYERYPQAWVNDFLHEADFGAWMGPLERIRTTLSPRRVRQMQTHAHVTDTAPKSPAQAISVVWYVTVRDTFRSSLWSDINGAI